jgi:hypothetical protein
MARLTLDNLHQFFKDGTAQTPVPRPTIRETP